MSVSMIETQSHLPPWQQEHRGLRWMDMPGTDSDLRKLNFALFRRGEYDPNLEAVSDADSGLSDEALKTARRDAAGQVLVKGAARSTFGTIRHLTPRGGEALGAKLKARAEDAAAREIRMKELLARFEKAKETKGFVVSFVRLDISAHSAMARALGRGRACKSLRSATMDRVERAFKALKKEGWNL